MLWNDKQGTKFFDQPFADIFKKNRNAEFLKAIRNTTDDRSRMIYSNLLLEHLVDILLGHIIKHYSNYIKKTNPSYYNKIYLLDSFQLIPSDIIKVVHCLREIRNEFAHGLNVKSFDDLPKKQYAKIRHYYTTIFKLDSKQAKSIDQMVFRLEFFAIIGLDSFEPNIRLLGMEFNGKENKKRIDEQHKEMLLKQFDSLDQHITK